MDEARQARIALLKSAPGFSDLGDHVEEARAKWVERLGVEASTRPPGVNLDQGQLDYYRGYYAGARWALGLPEKADKKLTERTEEETSSE